MATSWQRLLVRIFSKITDIGQSSHHCFEKSVEVSPQDRFLPNLTSLRNSKEGSGSLLRAKPLQPRQAPQVVGPKHKCETKALHTAIRTTSPVCCNHRTNQIAQHLVQFRYYRCSKNRDVQSRCADRKDYNGNLAIFWSQIMLTAARHLLRTTTKQPKWLKPKSAILESKKDQREKVLKKTMKNCLRKQNLPWLILR